jgi:hypothetical protein
MHFSKGKECEFLKNGIVIFFKKISCIYKKIQCFMILDSDWLTSSPIDFEYKKYILLAYEQSLIECYEKKYLYPELKDVISHMVYVSNFIRGYKDMEESRKKIVDIVKTDLIHESLIDDGSIEEIKRIADFGSALLKRNFYMLKELYSDVEKSIKVSGQKIPFLGNDSGYVILKLGDAADIIYSYDVKFIDTIEIDGYGINMKLADEKKYYEDRYRKNVFDVIIDPKFDFNRTTIPVVKRVLLEKISGL